MDDGWLIDPEEEETPERKSAAAPIGDRCVEVARELLDTERYLSGAEIEFLERVAAGEQFDPARMQVIAINWGVLL